MAHIHINYTQFLLKWQRTPNPSIRIQEKNNKKCEQHNYFFIKWDNIGFPILMNVFVYFCAASLFCTILFGFSQIISQYAMECAFQTQTQYLNSSSIIMAESDLEISWNFQFIRKPAEKKSCGQVLATTSIVNTPEIEGNFLWNTYRRSKWNWKKANSLMRNGLAIAEKNKIQCFI